MRFLADVGISMSTVRALRNAGHDATHLREQGLQRLLDAEILDKARNESRVVLTFDLDFGELLALGLYTAPSVVIFRVSDQTPGFVTPRLMELLLRKSHELEQGAVAVVEDARYRIRRLPVRRSEDST